MPAAWFAPASAEGNEFLPADVHRSQLHTQKHEGSTAKAARRQP